MTPLQKAELEYAFYRMMYKKGIQKGKNKK